MSELKAIEQEKVMDLKTLFPIKEATVYSQELAQENDFAMRFFAVDKGQEIKKHSAHGDAMVNILSGSAIVTIGDSSYEVKTGETIVMPADIPHALFAKEAFQMLLILVKH